MHKIINPPDRRNLTASLLLCMVLITGCSSSGALQNPAVDATLWMQNAAEYNALTRSIYQAAASRLDSALADHSWTAYPPQKNTDYQTLPPAIVVDIDETVLDNSPFEARLIKSNSDYSPQKWDRWVREEKAEPVPGALNFLRQAAKKAITVFYVSNRDASLQKATVQNLKKKGFPLTKGPKVTLLKNEQSGWDSSKENRRKYVAKHYRILMFFGDNLNDFLPAGNISHQKRLELIESNHRKFGTQWFILPNPVYGSWQSALYNFDETLTKKQVQKRKLHMLDTKQ